MSIMKKATKQTNPEVVIGQRFFFTRDERGNVIAEYTHVPSRRGWTEEDEALYTSQVVND